MRLLCESWDPPPQRPGASVCGQAADKSFLGSLQKENAPLVLAEKPEAWGTGEKERTPGRDLTLLLDLPEEPGEWKVQTLLPGGFMEVKSVLAREAVHTGYRHAEDCLYLLQGHRRICVERFNDQREGSLEEEQKAKLFTEESKGSGKPTGCRSAQRRVVRRVCEPREPDSTFLKHMEQLSRVAS